MSYYRHKQTGKCYTVVSVDTEKGEMILKGDHASFPEPIDPKHFEAMGYVYCEGDAADAPAGNVSGNLTGTPSQETVNAPPPPPPAPPAPLAAPAATAPPPPPAPVPAAAPSPPPPPAPTVQPAPPPPPPPPGPVGAVPPPPPPPPILVS